MRLTHWLAGLARKQPLSRRFTRRKWHGDLRPAVELLEDRTLLAAPHPFDLSTLDGTNGFRIEGIDVDDKSGTSVSAIGDLNGDGYDDLLIGADAASTSGEAYVVFGKGNDFAASLDLSTLNGANGFLFDNSELLFSENVKIGHAVNAAGDFNGDGFADLLIGDPDAARSVGWDGDTCCIEIDPQSGWAYLVLGSDGAFSSNLYPGELDGTNGFRMVGIDAGDLLGFSVSTAGDFNGDGYDDLLVAAIDADPGGRSSAGETYVIFGSASDFAAIFDLTTLDGTNGFRLDGIDVDDKSGGDVSSAGDVNGDGYDDLLVAAFHADAGGASDAGETYIVFGSGAGFAASLDLSSLDGTNGFRLDGINADDRAGISVSTAGDVNGDGFADLIVGARWAEPDGISNAGESYVVFGKASGFQAGLDLAGLNGTDGFRLGGVNTNDFSGWVSNAGDVNGDGFDDLLIGATGAPVPGGDAGESYVVYGKSGNWPARFDLSALDGTDGFRLDGVDVGDGSGWRVSAAGDINGDGFGDLLIPAPTADAGGDANAGEIYVVFGGDFSEAVTHAGTTAADTLTGDAIANVIVAGQGDDTLEGKGGADVLYGAEGDDVLQISDTGFARVDGGRGDDTLEIDGSGITLDLTTIADNKVRGIESIDITGSGDNTLTVDVLEVLNLSDTSNTVVITRNVGDTVDIGSGWSQAGTETIDGSPYLVFTQGAATVKLSALFDLGDAPLPYPVTRAENGAEHVATGPTLGATRDTEADGTHSAAADADGSDEDGVVDTGGTIRVGQLDAGVTVNVQNAPSGAKLDAWMDFNGDGSWGGPGEQIFASQAVVNGDNALTFDVPSWAVSGTTYARLRLSTAGALGVTGSASDGEVEDYEIEITPPVATSGVFGSQEIISTSADEVVSVFAADVDGDGDIDILSASNNDNKIAWYQNNGSQNFTARTISTLAAGAKDVFAIDVDGDGDMDVLSASQGDDKIAWYENDGSQNFSERVISTEADSAYGVFAADMDGDGDLDVLSASRNDHKIAWYENDGSQNFTERVISTTAYVAFSVFAADVNGDGHMDVLSASALDDKIAWYENDGSQNFVERVISTSADGATSVFAVDIDGDGDTDVLSALDSGNTVAWYENDGSQNFDVRVITDAAETVHKVFAADMDGDGDLDVLSASRLSNEIAWYKNDGSQNFSSYTITTSVNNARSVFVADVDGDGDLDVLSASRDDSKLAWYEQNATPTLDPIGDLAIDEDAAEQTVNLTSIGAGGSESQPLRVTSSSSIAGLIPDPTISYSSADSTGSLKFTPLGDQSGTATITVTVEDGGIDGDLNTAGDNATFSHTFDVTVNAVDDPPVLASLPDLIIDEDDRIHNDDGTDFDNFVSDVDSDTTTIEFRIVNFGEIDTAFDVSIDMANDSDSFADRSNNAFHAHPDDDFNGSTVITIEARDAQGNVSAQQSFTLTVTAVNDVPVIVADSFATNEDEQLVVSASGVLANDSDIEDDPLTAVLVSDVSDGTLSLASDGGFAYTPDADFYGTDSFTYKTNDGSDDGNTVTVTIDVIQHPEIHGTLFHDLDGDGTRSFARTESFDTDPGWTSYLTTDSGNNFGFRDSDHTGGDSGAGEAGGTFTRSGSTGFYADTNLMSPLTLDGPIFASGEIDFDNINSMDGDMEIGFFSTSDSSMLMIGIAESHDPVSDSLRITPRFTLASGNNYFPDSLLVVQATTGPPRTWTLEYVPDPVTGGGVVEFTISGNMQIASVDADGNVTSVLSASSSGGSTTFPISESLRSSEIEFNAFGIQSWTMSSPDPNRSFEVYVDGLSYTSGLEPQLAGHTVFLDLNDNGILDAGESTTVTAFDDPATSDVNERGDYSFVDLTPGDYTVAWITPTGWQATTSSQSLTLVAGDVHQDVDLLEQFIVSATPTITTAPFADDGSADTVTIGPNGTNVEVTVNGNVVVRKPASELTSITVNGSGDDDTLIVDLGGLDASLGFAADLIFNGNGDGSDNDTLQLLNGSASNIAYSFADASDGTITIDDSSIEFSGLESILDNLTTDHREFTFATTDDVVTLSDDGTSDNGLLTLSSVSSSEMVTFTNPGTSMGIHLGSGADQLTVVSLDDGFAGTLTLNGEGGDDTIDASAVSVAIKQNGSGGDDILKGGSGNDTLNGGSGSDSLEGGAGNDKLQGQGTSYDTLSGGPGDDTLDGGDGYDRISETADVDFTATDSSLTGLGTDTLINIQLVQLFGGASDNTINTSGFTGRAFLNGAGGHDTLTGGGWYDRIFGGSGRDLITGGNSVVDSGTGLPTYDVLRGQGGNNDTLIGGNGADKLNGGAGHDSLIGGGGDDVLSGESGDDTLDGGAGTDRLYERANVDMTLTDASLSGGLGSDDLTSIETAYLKGGNSNNRLNASAFSGDVTLIGVGGADTLKGGSGADLLNGRSGDDSLTGGDGDDTLKGMRDNDVLNGGSGNDWLDGGTQDDSISGWTGDDILYGRSGNDILVGGDGNDTLYGADGADITLGDDVDDDSTLTRDDDWIDAGAGQDTVRGGDGTDQMMDDVSEVDENFAFWADWVDAV